MSFENDNNNNNNNNKKQNKSLYRFLDKQGFYLILLLCVSIVLVTAVWVSRQEEEYFLSDEDVNPLEEEFNRVEVTLVEEDADEDENIQEAANIGETEEPKEAPAEVEVPAEETALQEKPKQPLELKESPKKQEEEPATTTTAKDYIMTQPVVGKVGLPYATDRLVYHKTLDHWSTHRGMDIHAEVGAPVRAVLDGEVVEVINDTIMGITITLQHDDELLTRYSNLSTDAMVKMGQRVTKGQVISGVGRTAAIKTEEGPLLHFQVILNGETVDPQNYLPKIN
ncbi:M23 family metallopeptidase [Natronincola ferrireducens]|uniref:Peptidase family M23 n=1 Tax=Natronincola ferrireducens TaxID=393762 RepID=A0A1G8XIB6_9FIRM|nr:M23 family metallopeptidase [Natronincola ferrireducens]SDJ89974.1 Peptidase family M23 [Natronincola ferrireducens]